MIEIKNYAALQAIIKSDYPTYSGKVLEMYFKPELLARKVEHLKNKLLDKYQIEMVCLSLEDM